jgi:hypothetical protein
VGHEHATVAHTKFHERSQRYVSQFSPAYTPKKQLQQLFSCPCVYGSVPVCGRGAEGSHELKAHGVFLVPLRPEIASRETNGWDLAFGPSLAVMQLNAPTERAVPW